VGGHPWWKSLPGNGDKGGRRRLAGLQFGSLSLEELTKVEVPPFEGRQLVISPVGAEEEGGEEGEVAAPVKAPPPAWGAKKDWSSHAAPSSVPPSPGVSGEGMMGGNGGVGAEEGVSKYRTMEEALGKISLSHCVPFHRLIHTLSTTVAHSFNSQTPLIDSMYVDVSSRGVGGRLTHPHGHPMCSLGSCSLRSSTLPPTRVPVRQVGSRVMRRFCKRRPLLMIGSPGNRTRERR
jgi:hypothetical protein